MATRLIDTLLTRLQFTGDTKALDEANKRVERLRKGLRGLSTGMLAVGGAAAGASFFVGRTNLDAQRAENNLRAVGQLTADEFARLEQQARQFGSSTPYAYREVIGAQTQLKLSGQSVNDVLATTPHVMHLAAAGQLEMGRAAELVTNQLNAYNLEGTEAQRVADVLAAIATSSSTTVAQLGVSFRQVASDARAMNMDIEQTGAVFAVLRNLGFTAEKTGVVTRNFLSQVRNPTKEGEDVLRSMLENVGIAYEEFRGLILTGNVGPALDALSKSMVAVGTEQEQIAKLDLIFNPENSGAINALLTNLDLMKRLENQYRDVTGTVRQMFETQTEGMVGTVGALRSAWEELQLSVGKAGFNDEIIKWMEGLRGALSILTEWVNARKRLKELEEASFGTADWREYHEMSWFDKRMMDAKASLAGMIAPAVVVTGLLMGLGTAIMFASFALKPFWAIFKGGLTVLRGAGGAFRTLTFNLWRLYYYGHQFVNGPGRALLQWGRNVTSAFRNLGGRLLQPIARGIGQFGPRIVQALAQFGPRIAQAVVQWGPRIVTGIITWGPRVVPAMIGLGKIIVGGVSASAVAAGAAAVAIPAAIAAAIVAGVAGVAGALFGFDVLWESVKSGWDSFANLWRNPARFWAEFKAEWQALMMLFSDPGRFFRSLGQEFRQLGDLISDGPVAQGIRWLGRQWQTVTGAINGVWQWLTDQIRGGGVLIGDVLRRIQDAVYAAGAPFRWVQDKALSAFGYIVSGVNWLEDRFAAGTAVIANALRALGFPVDWLGRQWQWLQQKIGAALAWIADRALDVAEALPDVVLNKVGVDVGQLEDFAARLRNPLDDAFPAAGPRVPIAPPNAATVLAAAGGGGAAPRNVQTTVGAVNVNISIDGAGDPRESALAVEQQFREQMRQTLETLVHDADSRIAE